MCREVGSAEAGRAASHLERVRNLAVALHLENEVEEVLRMFTVFRVSVGTQDAKP